MSATTTELPPNLAERFWSHSAGRESEDLPEPERSVAVVRNFLSALERLDVPVLIAMLRRAEVEGDLSYASPEQVRGENLDARAIVFSLGVVLFERLTGRHPFGAENNRPRRVDRIRRGEMGSGVNSFPTIPSQIRTVLVRAMSPFAEERWADLRELRAQLRNATPDEISIKPPVKLPGASVPETLTSEDITKEVRLPTQFGQELMKVVDDHGRSAGAGPSAPRRSKPSSAPPPSGAARATSGSASGVRPAATAPAGAVAAAAAGAPVRTAANSASGTVPEAAAAAATAAAAKAAASAASASAAKVSVATVDVEPPPAIASPRRPSTVTIPDLQAAPRRVPVGLIAGIAAAAGAAIAVVAMIVLRPAPKTKPPSAPTATPVAGADPVAAATVPVAAAATVPVAAAGTVAAPAAGTGTATAPATAPAPATVPATGTVATTAPGTAPATGTAPTTGTAPATDSRPAPPPVPAGGTVNDTLTATIQSCLGDTTATKAFGFSIYWRDHLAGKPYFEADSPLPRPERTCMQDALKGITAADAPATGDALYSVRITAAGIAIKARSPKPE